MSRFSIPILAWVIVGLLMVSALPFVVTWLQIDRSREALVVETQQTQRMVARSVADELARHYEVLSSLLVATANDPAVWTQPDSEAAGEALARALEMHPDFQAIGSFMSTPQGVASVLQLRRGGVDVLPEAVLGSITETAPVLIQGSAGAVVRLQQETPRPGQFLVLVTSKPSLEDIVRISGISEASIVLLDSAGQPLSGASEILDQIPPEQKQLTLDSPIPIGSHSDYQAEVPMVWAYAAVPLTGWRVITMQPAEAAERATTEMRSAARIAFALTLAVVALLSTGAWLFVVRPIRRLVKAQQQLAGRDGKLAGGEIQQLEDSFGRLAEAIQERDKLSEVFLDRYQIISQIGAGAMGMVYLGRDPKLGRHIALKTILIGGDLDPAEREQLSKRLMQEGLTAAKLTHPNIVTIFDVLGDENHAFIAMEYVEGESLEDEIDRSRLMSPRRVAEIAEGVLKALVAAHKEDVIHRDIKPGNILVTRDGIIKLSDFGIASYRRQVASGDEGLVLGTPGYLAPECYKQNSFDARTDLFALGVTLVECLTGATPFGGRNLQQIITRTSMRDVIIPSSVRRDMPEMMVDWIGRLLSKNPLERINSASEALNELREFQIELALAPEPHSSEAKPAGEIDRDLQTTAAIEMDDRSGPGTADE
jgi:hypothetical protein